MIFNYKEDIVSCLQMANMIQWKELDSVIFQTLNLKKIREFYEELLQLTIALYEKEGQEIQDVTDRYVNYKVGGSLIGFEIGEKIDTGSIVLRVSNLAKTRAVLENKVALTKNEKFFILFSDPDGREIIIEQAESAT